MSTHAMHHSTYSSAGTAALATALVIGGVAAAGLALASTHGHAVPVPPAQVQPGPLPGLDGTAAGPRRSAPRVPLPGMRDFRAGRVSIRRG